MRVPPFPPVEMRRALLGALPDHDQSSADLRPPQFTYLPPSHARALNPDNTLVEGMRGAGKSHWWNFLNSPEHLGYLEDSFPEARIATSLDVSQGFGVGLDPTVAPSKDTLVALLQRHNARHIWQAVIAVQAEFHNPFPGGGAKWRERVQWVRDNPEDYDAILYKVAESLKRKGRKGLILFDALDRLADDWRGVRPLARALFQLALDTSASLGLRLKLFVRPDMLEDKEILAFPDSSKLLARKVALTWRRADLYALLFQCLANDKNHGEVFRNHIKKVFRLRWEEKASQTYLKFPSSAVQRC